MNYGKKYLKSKGILKNIFSMLIILLLDFKLITPKSQKK